MDPQANDQPNNAPAPLPDFVQIGEAYGILHRQYPLMQNVPGHRDVLNAVYDLRAHIDHRFTLIEGRIAGIEGLLGEIRNKERNSATQADNARAFLGLHSTQLQPLLNVRSGNAINGFPCTIRELEGLNAATADRILNELQIPFNHPITYTVYSGKIRNMFTVFINKSQSGQRKAFGVLKNNKQ
ncbi:hypothetical protein BGZ61DRAFT_526503 [Ilyonectria robusta]|uniref:uncharacterized protein n=1 Tax=Ilyonectria robusta TaxID=1079257 RepID=UPI001E8D717C|nr:uncharacterized protein BGZ61DRAFT_526503 [Ilyonectria robusta]KAH8735410.1 hypothetical protein BGZ61DRAFT_526503 [Ilyonectria robusta]